MSGPRAIWTGAVSFGPVNVPIKLVGATSAKDIHFNQLHASDGGRIQQKRVCSIDGAEVDYGDIVKGFEIRKGQYVVMDGNELDNLQPQKTKSIDLEEFVDLASIDPLFFEKSYYLVPDAAAEKPYALLVAAMEQSGQVGIGKFVLRTKEYLVAVRPLDGALVLSTLMWDNEIVGVADLDIKGPADALTDREMKAALMLVQAFTAVWDPSKYSDTYTARVMDVIEAKAAGNELAIPEEAPAILLPVTDLAAALEAALAGLAAKAPAKAAPKKGRKSA